MALLATFAAAFLATGFFVLGAFLAAGFFFAAADLADFFAAADLADFFAAAGFFTPVRLGAFFPPDATGFLVVFFFPATAVDFFPAVLPLEATFLALRPDAAGFLAVFARVDPALAVDFFVAEDAEEAVRDGALVVLPPGLVFFFFGLKVCFQPK